MATLNLSFTNEEVAAAQKDNFDPIPAGNYTVEVSRSEVKATKDGTGSYLSLGFKVLEGDYAGRLIFQIINLTNKNPVASQIGREQLAQLAGACGVLQLQDSQQLHGIPVGARVAIKKDPSGQYNPSNEIKKFLPLNNPMQSNQGFTAPQSAPQGNPWARQ